MKPMLAAKADLTKIQYPVLVSPKLDGVRAVIVNGVVMSRTMKPIPNKHVQKLFGKHMYSGFDGELIVGQPTDQHVFRNTTSGVMSVDGRPDVTFHVFDEISSAVFQTRLNSVMRRINADANMHMVQHYMISRESELLMWETQCVNAGYEGVMLRDRNGLYKQGRSTVSEGGLLKLKRFEDSEAVVLGAVELQHNHNDKVDGKRTSHKAGKSAGGVLGALQVRDLKTGVEFEIGSGFTSTERSHMWLYKPRLAGLIVKYKYFATGSKDKPRFPTFEGFRDEIDLGEE